MATIEYYKVNYKQTSYLLNLDFVLEQKQFTWSWNTNMLDLQLKANVIYITWMCVCMCVAILLGQENQQLDFLLWTAGGIFFQCPQTTSCFKKIRKHQILSAAHSVILISLISNGGFKM